MSNYSLSVGCLACQVNRRSFFKKGALACGSAALSLSPLFSLAASNGVPRTRIRIIYALHTEKQDRPDWPNKGFNFKPFMDRVNNALSKRFKQLEFIPTLAAGEEQAKAILEQDTKAGTVDGYLVYQMNCWNRVVQTLATSHKPVLYADFQFGGSGGFLVYNAGFLRDGTGNVGFVASSRMPDLFAAVKCFGVVKQSGDANQFSTLVAQARQAATPHAGSLAGKRDRVECLRSEECLARLKQTRILAIRDQTSGSAGEIAGVQIQQLPFAELNQAWKDADKAETQAVADLWQKTARKIEGVPRDTLESSAAMYLAEKALLKKHGAMGITINCLGGFYGGHIHAYPCLGFHQLNNEGFIGGCECDVRSAATMAIGTTLTRGRPGYISDPVIDTAKRQIIYAHCVASNRVFGPAGHANPFDILTHSEDRQGASVRSVLPVGYITTTLEFEPSRKEILFHRALAVANDPDDRACRTKLCAEPVGDIERLFREWDQWGWHRVTFYGDLKEPVYGLAEALGWKVKEEA